MTALVARGPANLRMRFKPGLVGPPGDNTIETSSADAIAGTGTTGRMSARRTTETINAAAVITDLKNATKPLSKFVSGVAPIPGGDWTSVINLALADPDYCQRVTAPANVYGIEASGTAGDGVKYGVISNKGVSLLAEAMTSTILCPLTSIDSNTDLFRCQFNPPGHAQSYEISGFTFQATRFGAARGKRMLYIDATASGSLGFLRLSRLTATSGNDYSIHIKGNPAVNTQGSPFRSVFEELDLGDGMKLEHIGDSNLFSNVSVLNSDTARNALDISVVAGGGGTAGSQTFINLNAGGKGCPVVIHNGRGFQFINPNLELGNANATGSTGGTNGAVMDLRGDLGRIIGVSIQGGQFSAFADTAATKLIHVGNAQGVEIGSSDRVKFGSGRNAGAIPAGVNISSDAIDTVIGRYMLNDAAAFTAVVVDAGTGTMGIFKTLTLATGFGNLGSGFTTASYHKDEDGFVTLRGLITVGAVANGDTIGTLPAGFRPTASERFALDSQGVATPIDIASSGVITYNGPGTPNNPTLIPLTGIRFYVGLTTAEQA